MHNLEILRIEVLGGKFACPSGPISTTGHPEVDFALLPTKTAPKQNNKFFFSQNQRVSKHVLPGSPKHVTCFFRLGVEDWNTPKKKTKA
jgi:hypothetical protein